MEPDDFFHHAANAISNLINQRPWSPTVGEIAEVIKEAWWQSLAILDAAMKRRRRRRGKA
jgi:hypothetical protein